MRWCYIAISRADSTLSAQMAGTVAGTTGVFDLLYLEVSAPSSSRKRTGEMGSRVSDPSAKMTGEVGVWPVPPSPGTDVRGVTRFS